MYRRYRVRLYPTKSQEKSINQNLGNCRFIYNYFLTRHEEDYKNSGKSKSTYDYIKEITQLKKDPQYEWLKLGSSASYQQEVLHLDEAYKRFFSKKSQHPKYHSKKGKQSYTISGKTNVGEIKGNKLKLPKAGYVKFRGYPSIPGTPIAYTVIKTPAGKYYCSILSEVTIPEREPTGALVGIDMGLDAFLITSDGEKIPNPRFIKNAQDKLALEQRKLSRKKKGSRRYEKQRIKAAKAHEHVANCRKDFQHKVSSQIANDYDIVYMETLDIQSMLKNHPLAKSISDAAWYQFKSLLSYKTIVISIPQYAPSSQICSACSALTGKKDLSIREFTCPHCGTHHDRDINAAVNILNIGLSL